MKSFSLLFGLGLTVIYSHAFSQQIHNLNLSIQGEPGVSQDLEHYLQSNPEIKLPDNGTEYHIKIVEPDPSIEFKILNIEVDPKVDFKLRLINPISGETIEPVSGKLIEQLTDKFRQAGSISDE